MCLLSTKKGKKKEKERTASEANPKNSASKKTGIHALLLWGNREKKEGIYRDTGKGGARQDRFLLKRKMTLGDRPKRKGWYTIYERCRNGPGGYLTGVVCWGKNRGEVRTNYREDI